MNEPRIILKDTFVSKYDNQIHSSSMKCKKVDNDEILVWINNGEDRYCMFKLNRENMNKLKEFLG